MDSTNMLDRAYYLLTDLPHTEYWELVASLDGCGVMRCFNEETAFMMQSVVARRNPGRTVKIVRNMQPVGLPVVYQPE